MKFVFCRRFVCLLLSPCHSFIESRDCNLATLRVAVGVETCYTAMGGLRPRAESSRSCLTRGAVYVAKSS